MRKKVLVITYYWPPAGGPGVQRAVYFVKYLRRFGWEPVVYTVKDGEYHNLDSSFESEVPDGIKVIKTVSKEPYYWYKMLTGRKKNETLKPAVFTEKTERPFLHRIAVWIRGNFFIPDARMWWIRPSIRFLTNYLKDNPVDAIFSTSPPQSLHLIAKGVKQKTGIPWIADFRDPWTGVHYFEELQLSRRAKNKHYKLENQVLRTADQVIATTQTMAKDLEILGGRPVAVITNGFDTIPTPDTNNFPKENPMKMLYLGSLSGNRNPVRFWESLKEWIEEKKIGPGDFQLVFVGNIDESVFQTLERLKLSGFYNRHSFVPHTEVWNFYAKADLLFLLGLPGKKDILPAKLFEYLTTRKPIFCISDKNGEIRIVLEDIGAGVNTDFDEPEKSIRHLDDMYQMYRQGILQESFQVKEEDLKKYTRENLTEQLAQVLNEVTEPPEDIGI